jgi:hypothetical protein
MLYDNNLFQIVVFMGSFRLENFNQRNVLNHDPEEMEQTNYRI